MAETNPYTFVDNPTESGVAVCNTDILNDDIMCLKWMHDHISFRNIGEIVTSTIPLEDAGLHLLDGALLQYGSYSAFVDYIADLYNTTKQYNSNAFTIVGAPTITSEGVASGFSDSKYLKTTSMSFGSSVWEISGKFTFASSSYNQSLFSGMTNASGPLLYITGSTGMQLNIPSSVGTWGWQLSNASHTFTVGNTYCYRAGWDGTNYYIKISDDLGSTWTTLQTLAGTAMLGGSGSFDLALGANPAQSNRYITGSIDLKEYQISVGGVTTFRGAKTSWSCLEADWQYNVTQYGVCGKFVYNSGNNTVRLPKYGNQIWSGGGNAPVVGNGTALGFTDGTNNFGVCPQSDGGGRNFLYPHTTGYGVSVGSLVSGGDFSSSKAVGITTDSTRSGIIADLSNITTSLDGYYYIVVATTTKTSIQVDIDEIATDLNGKADVDLNNINASASAKNTINSWGIPDYSSVVSLGSPTDYQILPCDCYVYYTADTGNSISTAGFYYANSDGSYEAEFRQSLTYVRRSLGLYLPKGWKVKREDSNTTIYYAPLKGAS